MFFDLGFFVVWFMVYILLVCLVFFCFFFFLSFKLGPQTRVPSGEAAGAWSSGRERWERKASHKSSEALQAGQLYKNRTSQCKNATNVSPL